MRRAASPPLLGEGKLGAVRCQKRRNTHKSQCSAHFNPTRLKVISRKPRPNLPTCLLISLQDTYYAPNYLTYSVSRASLRGSLTHFTDTEKAAQRLTCPRQGHTITKWRCSLLLRHSRLETGLLVLMSGCPKNSPSPHSGYFQRTHLIILTTLSSKCSEIPERSTEA